MAGQGTVSHCWRGGARSVLGARVRDDRTRSLSIGATRVRREGWGTNDRRRNAARWASRGRALMRRSMRERLERRHRARPARLSASRSRVAAPAVSSSSVMVLQVDCGLNDRAIAAEGSDAASQSLSSGRSNESHTFSMSQTSSPASDRRYAVVSPARPDPMTATLGLPTDVGNGASPMMSVVSDYTILQSVAVSSTLRQPRRCGFVCVSVNAVGKFGRPRSQRG